MPRKMPRRNTSTVLSNTLNHDLKPYTVAAIAAGVSILALAPPAEGKVVVTRKTIPILVGQPVFIDLNHDGFIDFQFSLTSSFPACTGHASLLMTQPAGGAVVGGPIGSSVGPYASALVRGAKIGPTAHFAGTGSFARVETSFFEFCSGSNRQELQGHWGGNPNNRYLGVKFLIHGTTHYGWIRLTVDFPSNFGKPRSATVTAYAYETVANKAIDAGGGPPSASQIPTQLKERSGKPSLGMLAVGAGGLALWRREENPARMRAD